MKFIKNKKSFFLILFLLMIFIVILLVPYTKEIIKYLFLYFLIIIGSFSLSYSFKKKIEQMIPLYFLILFCYMYLFGLFNILLIGYFSFVLLNIIIGFYCAYKIVRNKEVSYLNDYFFRPGLIVFSVIFYGFALFSRNAAFYVWDEFTFWSIASKNMFYLNNFYVLPGTTLNIFYPPSPTIFQFFFCKTLMHYSQGIELFASYIISFSLMLPFLKNFSYKDKKSIFLVFLSIIIIPSIFCNNDFYHTIYVDVFLGLLSGYILFEYFNSDDNKFTFYTTLLSLAVLSLTKSTGFILSGIIIFVLLLNSIIFVDNNRFKIKLPSKNSLKKILVMLLIIFTMFISWKIYLKCNLQDFNNGYHYDVGPERKSIFGMFKCIFDTTIGSGNPENKTFRNFMDHAFDSKVFVRKPFEMYGSSIIVLFILGFYLIYQYLKGDKKFLKKSILYAVFTILYVGFIQAAYYLVFSAGEAANHSSIERYFGTVFVVLLFVLFGEIFCNYRINKKHGNIFLATIVLLLFAPYNAIMDGTFTSASHNAEMQAGIKNQRVFAEYIKSKINKSDRVFAIHQTQSSDSFLIQFRYFMTPIMIPMVDSFNDDEHAVYYRFKSIKDFSDELYNNYDYVVTLITDEYFDTNYAFLFKDNKVESWSLYKIIKNEDKTLLLERVE